MARVSPMVKFAQLARLATVVAMQRAFGTRRPLTLVALSHAGAMDQYVSVEHRAMPAAAKQEAIGPLKTVLHVVRV